MKFTESVVTVICADAKVLNTIDKRRQELKDLLSIEVLILLENKVDFDRLEGFTTQTMEVYGYEVLVGFRVC